MVYATAVKTLRREYGNPMEFTIIIVIIIINIAINLFNFDNNKM